jgi:hypothetical protein
MVAPIFMTIGNVITKILIKYHVYSLRLSIGLWMENDIKF